MYMHILQNPAFHHTPIPRVSSSEALDRTHRRRRDTMSTQRESITGGSALPKDQRQKMLTDAGVGVEMDATQVLATKADLAIPWYRLRVLRSCANSLYRFRVHV